jgi:hypothetical protein
MGKETKAPLAATTKTRTPRKIKKAMSKVATATPTV